MNERIIGVFHTFVAAKLKEKCSINSNTLERSVVRKLLYIYHVPVNMHQKFLEEMQGFKLVKIKDKQNIEILYNREKASSSSDWFG